MREYEIVQWIFQGIFLAILWGLIIWGEIYIRKKYPDNIQKIRGKSAREDIYIVSITSRYRTGRGYTDFTFAQNKKGKFYMKANFHYVFSLISSIFLLIASIILAILIALNPEWTLDINATIPCILIIVFGVFLYWIAGRERIAARICFYKYKKKKL